MCVPGAGGARRPVRLRRSVVKQRRRKKKESPLRLMSRSVSNAGCVLRPVNLRQWKSNKEGYQMIRESGSQGKINADCKINNAKLAIS